MDAPRIAALLEPFLDHPLTETQLKQISTYIDLLLRWNARINLTAIRAPEEIIPRHFGESFFLARHLFPDPCHPGRRGIFASGEAASESKDPSLSTTSPPQRVLDLGSGAGFPAVPIKIWAPRIHLTMIESNHKKAAFLREVSRALILTDINVIAERAESLSIAHSPASVEDVAGSRGYCSGALPAGGQGANEPGPSDTAIAPTHVGPKAVVPKDVEQADVTRADVVTFRAVEKFDQILPLAQTFLAPRGRLALLISTAQLTLLNSLPDRVWHFVPIPESSARILAISE